MGTKPFTSAMGEPLSTGTAFADPRELILKSAMSTAQKVGVATTLLLTATDGFDILAMSFAGPGVRAEWGLTYANLGIILGLNIIGLALGAVFISPIADRIGRRKAVLFCMLAIAATMFLSAIAPSPVALGALRFVTGLGIGGMVGATLSLATEYANSKNRPLTAAVMSIGLPIGGMFGAIISAQLLTAYDWRAIFLAGGVITLAVTLVAAALLPESVEFLIGRKDAGALQPLNRILIKYGQPALAALPPTVDEPRRRSPYATLLSGKMRRTTLAMATLNFTQMMTIFFFVSWLPQTVTDMGFSSAQGATVSAFQNAGGIIGAITVGIAARSFSPAILTMLAAAGTGLAVICFTLLPPTLGILRAGAAVEGFMALGSSAGIYAVLASAFPAAMRSTGIGFSYGFGRLGSILAVVTPGFLYTAGWTSFSVALLLASGSAIAIAVLLAWTASIKADRTGVAAL